MSMDCVVGDLGHEMSPNTYSAWVAAPVWCNATCACDRGLGRLNVGVAART